MAETEYGQGWGRLACVVGTGSEDAQRLVGLVPLFGFVERRNLHAGRVGVSLECVVGTGSEIARRSELSAFPSELLLGIELRGPCDGWDAIHVVDELLDFALELGAASGLSDIGLNLGLNLGVDKGGEICGALLVFLGRLQDIRIKAMLPRMRSD